ncbi:MAG: polyprenyl synthetase family protein [Acutalibacteraceae bacterium]
MSSNAVNQDIELIEKALEGFLPDDNCLEKTVIDSMRYSLMAGGKRVRPRLVLEFARLCGEKDEEVLPLACAVEMIHTYSLIHDDLPCMDDDDTRRGKPSNHKVFGEAAALLAGDSLLTLAFKTAFSGLNAKNACRRAKCAELLAEFAGATGMIGGQIIDLESEGKAPQRERLEIMDKKKTGCLIKAACLLGCVGSGVFDEKKLSAAESYGESIGLAFQVVDDILDVTSTTQQLGKPVGSDMEQNKATYVSLLGIDECKRLAQELTDKAIKSLDAFDGDSTALKELAMSLAERKV